VVFAQIQLDHRQPWGIQTMSSRRKPPHKTAGPAEGLRLALGRLKKADLVEILMELAEADRGILRQLTTRLDVAVASDELVAATRQAIADATAFDVRDINRNFAYDYAAYDAVKRNLGRMIESGQLGQAMELSLELMKRGSYQVEMSDEGLMTTDIEACLNVVLEAVRKSDLPAAKMLSWCSAMLSADRVGFIAHEPLTSLQNPIRPPDKA
jgi:hypothetical protein